MATCKTQQRYIESRVTCERVDPIATIRNCTVIEPRPSQKRHITELISHLNLFRIWSWLTTRLPMVVTYYPMMLTDILTQYLNDPKLTNMTLVETDNLFLNVNNIVFSQRLSQVFNTYLLLSQLFLSAPSDSTDGGPLEHNITTEVPNTILVQVHVISRLWNTLGIVSCCILLAGGISSVIFRCISAGPDILGYASTVIRDSKYIDLPPQIGTMDGIEVTKKMKSQRLKYGLTHLTIEGQHLVGVGLEERTRKIKDHQCGGEDEQGHYDSIQGIEMQVETRHE
ncbi:hypothetical protein BS50DRAFT_593935 [Corynespora cassiicola Philippines]|uniref:Uncharacterized protein n=1 Tax=Corynespora cassiicola Philippines TaxID=1448308 RepID=A0A2T2N3Y3_CORCC|nr:hypothetical protein BS50DRAFT_593935 [Corynespora cassiicola Philippines]